jgi:hypothetical protein
MKIEKTAPTCTFQPISITITIESEEDLKAIREMAGYNVTLSETLAEYGEETVKTANKFFKEIYRVLVLQ